MKKLSNEAINHLKWYEMTKANEIYYIVFEYKKVVYLYKTTTLKQNFVKEKMSSKHEKTLAMNITKQVKEYIINNDNKNVQVLMTKKEFDKKCKYYKTIKNYNKGNVTELLIYKMNNQKYSRDNVAYYDDGDITIDGVKVQVKYQNATIARYATIEKALNNKLNIK